MSVSDPNDSSQRRNQAILDQARADGILGAIKDSRVSGRVSATLLQAAKQRARVTSDSALLELALSKLALEDDFGSRIMELKGRVPVDIDLEF